MRRKGAGKVPARGAAPVVSLAAHRGRALLDLLDEVRAAVASGRATRLLVATDGPEGFGVAAAGYAEPAHALGHAVMLQDALLDEAVDALADPHPTPTRPAG